MKNILLYIIIIAEFIALVIMFVLYEEEKRDKNDIVIPVTEQVAEEKTEPEDNKIIIHDNGNSTVEYPDIEAPKNTYDFSELVTDDKKKKMLYKDGEQVAVFGIDVSQYQGNVDWNRVKADGVEFAILRLGYRGYETGNIKDDSRFLDYVRGTSEAGIDIGVYFYSQAINEAEAKEEAEYVLNVIRENNIELKYPVVFDWEFVQDEDPARTDNLSSEKINACCKTFCRTIKAAGYDTMFYANITDALFKYDLTQVSEYGLWLAEYSRETDFIYDFDMWQYSCSGLIDGIDSLVDLNLWFIK